MALVDEHDEVSREVIEQCERRLTGQSAVEVARVVLYARAIPYLLHHLYIVAHALAYALSLDQLMIVGKELDLLLAVALDIAYRVEQRLPLNGVMARGKDSRVRELCRYTARHYVELAYAVYLVAEKLDAYSMLGHARGKDIDCIASHAEFRALRREVVALIIYLDEPRYQRVARHFIARTHRQREPVILLGRAQAVDTGNGRDDYRIAPLVQRACRAVAEFVYLVVYREVLFYISIRRRQVRLGLIVVVITDEKFDAVFGKELAELVTELSRKSLVMRKHERRALSALDDVRHGKGLAAARYAFKHLRRKPVLYAVGNFPYRLGLIARRLILTV